MRKHVRLGVLVALLAMLAVAVYVQRQAMASDSSTYREVAIGQTMFVGTIRLELDAGLLARLDAESPKLTLEAADGAVVPVLMWKVDGSQAVLQQFHNMQPSHYTSLVITWPDGTIDRVAIDVQLSIPSQG